MSLDKFASSDGTLPTSSTAPAPEESDEDLFDFDELSLASSRVAAEMRRELDEALDQVDEAKHQVAQSVPAAAAPARPAVAPRSITAPANIVPQASEPSATTVVHQKLTMSPFAGLLLSAVVIANVVLMLFAWRSVSATKDMVLDVASEVRDTTSDLRDESSRRTEIAALESEPVFGALPEGYRTLQIARERLGRGEYARARRMLYGLLCVIDRLEAPARQEVEAQAGFLIADSFRLEADALSTVARRELR